MTARALRFVVVAIVALAALAPTGVAYGHEEGGSQEAYLLVQQALAHLAHDSSLAGIDEALEKVDDALAADDQEGVDRAGVQQGRRELEAGRVGPARTTLQAAITEAVDDLPLATGYQTGTAVVLLEQPGRGPLEGGDWATMAIAIAVGALGAWLTVRFRPRDNLAALRRSLAQAAAGTSPVRGSRRLR